MQFCLEDECNMFERRWGKIKAGSPIDWQIDSSKVAID